MSVLAVDAPAKVNLGLEILGRRDDGFHEVRTVLAQIGLCDTLEFSTAAADDDVIIVDGYDPDLATSDNLVATALNQLRQLGVSIPPQRVHIIKRIPVAAGLGGASTDAAATLRLFGERAGIPDPQLHAMASRIGSDVPFFLGSGFALARGRGEDLHHLPSPPGSNWVVIVVPPIHLPAKTATMYARVKPAWWTDGCVVERYAGLFPKLELPPPPNVFERSMTALRPEMTTLRNRLIAIEFPFAAMSGAGPAMFTICDSESQARTLAARAAAMDARATIHVARFASTCDSPDVAEPGT